MLLPLKEHLPSRLARKCRAAPTLLSKQGPEIVIKHINVPGIGRVARAHIGRAVKQRMKFKMLAVIYKFHIVLQNKLLYSVFMQKRSRGTAQLSFLRHPDHSPALLQGPKSQTRHLWGKKGKNYHEANKFEDTLFFNFKIMFYTQNCSVFPWFSWGFLILECDFKDKLNVLCGWDVTLSFDWAGPSNADVCQFCL